MGKYTFLWGFMSWRDQKQGVNTKNYKTCKSTGRPKKSSNHFFRLWTLFGTLDTFQSCPKGSKRDHGQPNCFWPFGSLLGPSGPFWTILDKNDFFAPTGQSRGWQRCFGAKYQFLFETVQKGPDGPKRVPNGQKHLGWPFCSLSGPVGPLCSVDKPAMFGPFWSKMDHF